MHTEEVSRCADRATMADSPHGQGRRTPFTEAQGIPLIAASNWACAPLARMLFRSSLGHREAAP
eukprot:1271874-Alexandrium_andersonii.AAC.1